MGNLLSSPRLLSVARLTQSLPVRFAHPQRLIAPMWHNVIYARRWPYYALSLAFSTQWMPSQVRLALTLPQSIVAACCCLCSTLFILIHSWPTYAAYAAQREPFASWSAAWPSRRCWHWIVRLTLVRMPFLELTDHALFRTTLYDYLFRLPLLLVPTEIVHR